MTARRDMAKESSTLKQVIEARYDSLTSKGKKLADFVVKTPEKAVFMTTRQLASAAGTSEATVVRFVRQLNFESYALFIKALKELVDIRLTLIERSRLPHAKLSTIEVKREDPEFVQCVNEDIESIREMARIIDFAEVRKIRELIKTAGKVYVIGARHTYAPAHYMGWALAKVRQDVFILQGSDSTIIDRLMFAGDDVVVVMIAATRYPNELINLGRLVKRYSLPLILLADSSSCPLVQFSDHALIAPSKSIPFLVNPASLISLINYLVYTQALAQGEELERHQERIEQAYLENNLLFNY